MATADALRAELARAARDLGAPADFVPLLERPRDPAHGDWATNMAMVLSKPLARKPRDLAQEIVGRLDVGRAGLLGAEIAGPGFINLRLDPAAGARALLGVVRADVNYGRTTVGGGERVLVEFVSANPTGPLHVGHGRQAALGDAIATLLEHEGWSVSREFYYNDAGVQIHNLGCSVQAHLRARPGEPARIPEGGYHGEYIAEIAARYAAAHPHDARGDDLAAVTRFAVAELRREQDLDMQAFGVDFDTYYLESSLYTDNGVENTVAALVAGGHAFEEGGALWLRTTDYGDDKDRVMRKRDGSFTYFVPDVAYHVTKWRRGFRRAINVQGADHHGTVTRVRAGLQALNMGIPEGYPEYVLHQMVTVLRGGEEVKISKRAGSYVTVRDLIDWVGRDAVRYFFLMRQGDSQLKFDVDLATQQSEENPVYRIQMAHARMSGIFRVGGIDPATVTGEGVDFALLDAPEEQALVKAIVDYPAMLAGAAAALEPHRVANWLLETAGLVHAWYHRHHVLNEPEAVTRARLLLARAAQIVIRNGLTVLGITAPDRM